MPRTRVAAVAAGVAVGLASLAACDGSRQARPTHDPSTSPTATTSTGASYAEWDGAVSSPREDSYYPAQGDPGIDSLHYGLDLTWAPRPRRLTGVATIAFRVPAESDHVQLDLSKALTVGSVTVDGTEATWSHTKDELRVAGAFAAESRHTLVVEYAGSPRPMPAPTTRSDFSTVGWNAMPDGEVWAMQEPFGSSTWYPSNDQPADKAFYDFVLRVPKRWVGVANGQLQSDTVSGPTRVMTWHLSQPASTYLTTIAIGDYVRAQRAARSGVPIDFWTPDGDRGAIRSLRPAPRIMDWLEQRLGPFPFDSLGFLIVPSRSGMETQTMITLGDTDYTRSAAVIQHEMVHQWYGDLVTPTDWRDVWMNEGITMFLQMAWEADQNGNSIDTEVSRYVPFEIASRAEAGPPGAYRKGTFGEGNIYYSPALMWNELRHQLGDERFWEMVKAWPRVHAYANATRAEYYAWLHNEYSVDRDFLDAWIMGKETPR